jgi:hypothetical protein
MRGIRITTISILVVGLLAGSAVGVAAQDQATEPGPEAASLVSGASQEAALSCGTVAFPEETQGEGVVRQRGRVCGGTAQMSDPRLSGEMTFMDNADRYIPGVGPDDTDPWALADEETFSDIVWGSVTIVNDGGTWEGQSVGTSDKTQGLRGITYHELAGTGAYDGLSAVLFMLEDETGLPLTGVIFPGALTDDR